MSASIVFMGTPEFAVPALRQLCSSPNYDIVALVTQPDKPANRGQKISPPPVKLVAEQHNVPIFQPKSIKKIELSNNVLHPGGASSEDLTRFLNELPELDMIVSVAYGKIIPSSLLDFPRCGIVNIHPSLLPRWRGAAPLQHAIFAGDQKTGVAIMKVDQGIDSGPVYGVTEVPIDNSDNLGTLHDKLAQRGADYLLELLPDILSGDLSAVAQAEDGMIYAEKWEKQDSVIRWNDPAEVTLRRIRASSPIPGCRSQFGDKILKIYAAHQAPDLNYSESSPGAIVESNLEELIVRCGDNKFIAIDEMQFPGKRRMPIQEIMRGHSFAPGERFE